LVHRRLGVVIHSLLMEILVNVRRAKVYLGSVAAVRSIEGEEKLLLFGTLITGCIAVHELIGRYHTAVFIGISRGNVKTKRQANRSESGSAVLFVVLDRKDQLAAVLFRRLTQSGVFRKQGIAALFNQFLRAAGGVRIKLLFALDRITGIS